METLNDFREEWKHVFPNISWVMDVDDKTITHLYWTHNDLCFCIVAPHCGNHYQWMLRVHPKRTFDRWSVADIEEFYDDLDDINEDLSYREWIYRRLLDIYIDYYLDDRGD